MSDPSGSDPLAPGPSYGGPPPTDPVVPQYGSPPTPYGTAPYGTAPYGTAPYGANPYGSSPYGYYPPGYGSQGYPSAPADRRPGPLTAAAVIGYVNGGLLILAGVFVFFGASLVYDLTSGLNGSNSYTAEFVLAGLANLLAAGLQIGGGVSMSGRRPTGRVLYAAGNGVTVAAAFYWVLRWALRFDSVSGLIIYALLFTALAVVGTALAFTRDANRWLGGGAG